MSELLKINKKVETFEVNLEGQIRSTPVNLKHKFILVHLVYNKATLDRDIREMDVLRDCGTNPVIGQSFSKFIDYNNLVLTDVKKTYTDTYNKLSEDLP